MHKKYAAKGLSAISVSLDEEDQRAQAERFLVKNNATFTNLWLDEPQEFWTKKFGAETLPCVFVFDRRGKWVQFKTEGDREVNYDEIEKAVVKLLAE
jgi:hypothetical protein